VAETSTEMTKKARSFFYTADMTLSKNALDHVDIEREDAK